MTFPALIFDFGNVLMHTVDYAPRHAWDRRLGLPPGTVERHVHNGESWIEVQQGRISIADYWHDIGQRLTLASERRLALSAEDLAQLALDFYAGDALNEPLIEAIRAWRNQSVTVGLLSNDSVELRAKLVRLGMDTLFDPLVISGEIGVMKPHADAYRAVLERVGRPAAETVFIDDRAENITGAQAVGMQTLHAVVDVDLVQSLTEIVGIAPLG